MRPDWPHFFNTARSIAKAAREEGVSKPVARALGERLATAPLHAESPHEKVQRLRQRLLHAYHEMWLYDQARAEGLKPRRARALAKRSASVCLSPASKDKTVVAAHRWLRAREPASTPALSRVTVGSLLPGVDAQYWHDRITVSPLSSVYVAAAAGDVAGLGVLLAHEQYHLAHPDAPEAEALGEEMRIASLHAPKVFAALVEHMTPAPAPEVEDDRE
jgi:hypothetical protein